MIQLCTEGGVQTQCLGLIGSFWVCPTGLGILLDVALGNKNLEIWTLTQDKECDLTGYLRGKLQYKNRLQYMVTRRAPNGFLFPSPKAHLISVSAPELQLLSPPFPTTSPMCVTEVRPPHPWQSFKSTSIRLSSYNSGKASRDSMRVGGGVLGTY